MFSTTFKATVKHRKDAVSEFYFTVTHRLWSEGAAAAEYLNSLNEEPGEVFFNYGAQSGWIKNEDGHICWFAPVE